MNDEEQLTPWEEAIEYGQHVMGVLPDQTVTGVLAHNGQYWKSYVDSGSWKQYPNWERDYDHTPLARALEAFVKGDELHTNEVVYDGEYYEPAPMNSAGLNGWRFEYERKLEFKSRVLRGGITFPAPALFNQYGDCYIEAGHEDDVVEMYWDWVDETYPSRQSHYEATETTQ